MKMILRTLSVVLFLLSLGVHGRVTSNPEKSKINVQNMMNDFLKLRTKEGFFDLMDTVSVPAGLISNCNSEAKHKRYFLAEFIKAKDVKIVVNHAKKVPPTYFSYEGDVTFHGIKNNMSISYLFTTTYNDGDANSPLEWKFSKLEYHKCHNHVFGNPMKLPTLRKLSPTVGAPANKSQGAELEELLNGYKMFKTTPNRVELGAWLDVHLKLWTTYDCKENMDQKVDGFDKTSIGDSLLQSDTKFKVLRFKPSNVNDHLGSLMVDGFRNKTFYYDIHYVHDTATNPWKISFMDFKGCIV